MTAIKYVRTHVDIRNGSGGINKYFCTPDYLIDLDEKLRVFSIYKRDGSILTRTPMENCIDFDYVETPSVKSK